ncbi:MAG: hypothetical protein JWO15_954 [Sphingomonadales bacterium]|nr:hypothetical protein [Sphingomonadales bacterium]
MPPSPTKPTQALNAGADREVVWHRAASLVRAVSVEYGDLIDTRVGACKNAIGKGVQIFWKMADPILRLPSA